MWLFAKVLEYWLPYDWANIAKSTWENVIFAMDNVKH